MQPVVATELVLIRHAPALTGGRLCGRTDVAADLGDLARLDAVRRAVGDPGRLVVSPALRCRQTAAALWPDVAVSAAEPDLWEQDFGAWEGRAFQDLPDLGPLPPEALAANRPPQGESFADMCRRAGPVLKRAAAGRKTTIVAHAGTVRAALALAIGSVPAALSFEVAPLSVTRLRLHPGGAIAIAAVNG